MKLDETKPLLSPGAAPPSPERLRQACQDLEEVFLRHLVRQMQATAQELGGEEPEAGERIYQGLIEETLSSALAKGGGVGLANLLFQQLQERLKTSEESAPEGSSPPEPPR